MQTLATDPKSRYLRTQQETSESTLAKPEH